MPSAPGARIRVRPLLSLLAVLVPGGVVAAQAPAEHPEWLRPCEIRTPAPALCGSYEVWEDRDARSGRRIPLYVVVVPARGPERQPDPVFYLAGGPGAGATLLAGGEFRLLQRANQRRDLVFVDVRGTGRSRPLLCPPIPADAPLQRYFEEFLADAFVRECLAHLDADVGLYTQPIAMDDLADVRAALGYGRINLYGVSGGTRQAQIYMRRHPESVRSAMLRGVVPMDAELPLPFARALETGVRGLVQACRAEAGCREAYPDLAADWERSTRRFEHAGGRVSATVKHPETGRRERVRIHRGVYADGVRHILYSVGASRRLPGLIYAAARGDFDGFAQMELEQNIEFAEVIADGMFLSSTCAEDLRFVSEDDIRRATEGTFLGDYRVRRQLAACRIWAPGKGVEDDFQRPVRFGGPVLLISGEFDTATPPAGAEAVARSLPRGRHIVFPNQSHDAANPGCLARLMADFLEAGSADQLDLGCVQETRRPPFDTGVGRERQ